MCPKKGITPIQSYNLGMGLRPSILYSREGPGFLGYISRYMLLWILVVFGEKFEVQYVHPKGNEHLKCCCENVAGQWKIRQSSSFNQKPITKLQIDPNCLLPSTLAFFTFQKQAIPKRKGALPIINKTDGSSYRGLGDPGTSRVQGPWFARASSLDV